MVATFQIVLSCKLTRHSLQWIFGDSTRIIPPCGIILVESWAGGIILVESSCYPRHQGLLSVSWWNYSGGIMLVESYWWNHELVELFWWNYSGGITAFEAFWPEPHPHVPLTQIWLLEHELLHDCQPSICCFKKYAPQPWHLNAHRPGFEPGS